MVVAESAKTAVQQFKNGHRNSALSATDNLNLASMKARNPSVAYNMRAVGGAMGGWRMLGNLRKIRFEHKYKDVPEEQKEALYLQETVDEFELPPEDTARLHQLRTASLARQYDAVKALPKCGVATFANAKETDPELSHKAIRGWAHVLEGQAGEQALREARKELDGLLEGTNLPPPNPPPPCRQNAHAGTPPPAPSPTPTPAETPPPLELPSMTRQYTSGQPQTTFAFDSLAEPSPELATPAAKPEADTPPNNPRPKLTPNASAVTNTLSIAGRKLEDALEATDPSGAMGKREAPSDASPEPKKSKNHP
jgi:hypothetical protein